MAVLENGLYQRGAAYYKDVQEQFRRATNDIQMDIMRWYQRLADNNDISYAGAKKLLKKNELEEFRWTVEQYIKAGEENSVDQRWMKELENASARHHISYLEAMKLQAQQHAEQLSTEFNEGMTDFLHKSYGEQYYHTAFEAAKGTGVGANLAQLDDRRIDTVIKKPWAQDGANFSDRIWTNKKKLVNNLHTELTQNIIRGASPQKATDSLSKPMNVSRGQAGRLIMTESAAVSAAAQKECFKDLGVEQYEILATLDSLTSDICREMDGKVFDMKDYAVGVTAPPFHPNCRSTTVPYFDDEFTADEERAARNEETGKTYYVPADMKYEEWKKQFVTDDDNEPIREKLTKTANHVFDYKEPKKLKELPKESRTELEQIILNSPQQIREFTEKHIGAVNFKNIRSIGRGYSNNEGIRVNLKADQNNPRGRYATTFHEIGHAIDKSLGRISCNNAEFKRLLKADFDTLVKAYQKEYNVNIQVAYEQIGRKVKGDEYHSISDLFGGLTNNQCAGDWMHDRPGYWSAPNRLEREAFAHFYSAAVRSPEEVERLKAVFPNAYNEFLRLLEE